MTKFTFNDFNIEDFVRQKPIDLMINTVTVPDGLDEKLLAAMTKQRKENEKKAKQKQEKRKNTLIRAALIAAIISLIIVATPMRGYVASAATDAWNAFHSWMDDVFHVGMKQTKNGCTVV